METLLENAGLESVFGLTPERCDGIEGEIADTFAECVHGNKKLSEMIDNVISMYSDNREIIFASYTAGMMLGLSYPKSQ